MPSSIEPHGGWHVVLVLCSVVRWCAAACIVAGGASDVHVRACVRTCRVCRAQGTLACGCIASCRPGTIACEVRCIVAAFAAHQWTSAVLDGGRCI